MKLSNSKRTFAIALAASLMSIYQLSPLPVWACNASSTGGFAYSSNTGPTSVTVCAKSVTTTRTVTPPTKTTPVKAPVAKAPVAKAPAIKAPLTKPSPKPDPVKVIAFLTPIQKGVPVALQKPVAKTVAKPVAKPVAKSTPKPVAAPTPSKAPAKSGAAVSTSTAAGEVSFSPSPISVAASAPSAAIGQTIGFWVNAATHYRSGVLLGKATDVRFTPIGTVWSSDQGQTSLGASVSLAFESPGSVEVSASVTYAVSYQIAGASGWVPSGEIAVSDSLSVMIDDSPEPPSEGAATEGELPSKVVRLVSKNCVSRTAVFGCNP